MDEAHTRKVDVLAHAMDIAIKLRDVEVPSGSDGHYVPLTSDLVEALNEALELELQPELAARGIRFSEAGHREIIERLRASS